MEPKYERTTYASGFTIKCDPKDAANVMNLVITGYPLAGHSDDVEFIIDNDGEYTKALTKSANALRRAMNISKSQPIKPAEQSWNLNKSKLSTAIIEVNRG